LVVEFCLQLFVALVRALASRRRLGLLLRSRLLRCLLLRRGHVIQL
jgi:hypothetical protein